MMLVTNSPEGRPVPVAETKPHGCSTKWMEKKASVATEAANWEKKPVDVELIDAAGVAARRESSPCQRPGVRGLAPTKTALRLQLFAT